MYSGFFCEWLAFHDVPVMLHSKVNLEAIFINGMRVFFGHHGGALQAPLDDLD